MASVNNRGGINGHKVQLLVYDDGSDPARTRAAVQEAVEKRGVISFLQATSPLTYGTVLDYLNAKRIPTVGSELASTWNYESPMLFPQGTGSTLVHVVAARAIAQQLKPLGKTKIALLYCAEAAQCRDEAPPVFTEAAASSGLQVVYKAQSSLAQPDYTAECIQARNAGAELFMVILDANSIQRVAASCNRQNYKPYYSVPVMMVSDQFTTDSRIDKIVAATNVFPYFRRGTQSVDEFHAAIAGGGLPVRNGTAIGWAAGKLLERAAGNLPQPPTANALLRGLWSIEGDDLSGLTAPLTFKENQRPSPPICWWNVMMESNKWSSPDGFERHCS